MSVCVRGSILTYQKEVKHRPRHGTVRTGSVTMDLEMVILDMLVSFFNCWLYDVVNEMRTDARD